MATFGRWNVASTSVMVSARIWMNVRGSDGLLCPAPGCDWLP